MKDKLRDINYAKEKLQEYSKKGLEVELCINIKGHKYMIIPFKDKASFQEIGVTDEFYYNSIEELFSSTLINDIILNRDWNTIEEIYYY